MAVTLDRPYCTLEEVQRFIGDTKADNVDAILSAINRASRYIDDKIARFRFYRIQHTAVNVVPVQGAPGSWTIWPANNSVRRGFFKSPYRPILKFSLVQNTGAEAPLALVEGTDYEVDYENGRVYCLGYGWSMRPETYLVTATMGCDNGTEDLEADPVVPYDPTVPADEAHGMSGDIHQIAIQVAATFSGLWMKKIFIQGSVQPETRFVNKVDKDTLAELYRWGARS
jgi:hypothetical protein